MHNTYLLNRRTVGAALLGGGALTLAGCGKGGTSGAASAEDMSMGNPNAKVTLIEYASVTCVHCIAFNEEVMPELKSKYIDTGKINYVYREFVTGPQDVSAAGILLARCAGRDKYFGVVDAVMRSFQEMVADGTTRNAKPVLLNIAKSVGMSEDQFNQCITDPKGLERLQTNVEKYSRDYNITGTPAFFINGEKFERKVGDISDFDKKFAELGVK